MALLGACLGWLVGLGLALACVAPGQAASGAPAAWLLLAALLGLAALVARPPALRLGALTAALLLLGWARGLSVLPALADAPLAPYYGAVALRGAVAAPPVPGDTSTALRLNVEAIAAPAGWQSVAGSVLLRLPRTAAYDYGERLEVRGRLGPLPGGGYGDLLRRQGVDGVLDYPAVSVLERAAGGPAGWLPALRGRLEAAIAAALPEPHAALLVGLLLGGSSTLPPDFRDAMRALGLTHLTAVSGFNVTIVAAAAIAVALRLAGRRLAWPLAAGAVVLFTLLVGAPPSALRAAAMALVALGAQAAGRPRDGLAALLLAAAGLTAWDPLLLLDLGFQLSALATAGLVLFEPWLRARLARLPDWLAEGLAVTLAAQALVLPLQLTTFHALSPLTPLANVLVVPLVPPLMALGLPVLAAGLVVPSLAPLVALPAWAMLELIVRVVQALAALPGARLSVGYLPPWLGALYLAALAGLALALAPEAAALRGLLARGLQTAPARAGLAAGAALLTLGVLAAAGQPEGRLRVAVLDVGQGDSTLIRTPSGRVAIVDGGPNPAALMAHLGARLGLAERAVDLAVLTHPHEDHLAGLQELVERYQVRQVVEGAVDYPSAGAERWRATLAKRGVPTAVGASGQRWQLDRDVWLDVWAVPAEPGSRADREEPPGALVLHLRHGATSLLLPGDLVAEQARRLQAAGGWPRADALLVPHHGSRTGLDAALLAAVDPRLAVISDGARNRFGHPAPFTLALLAAQDVPVWRTDQHGTIELVSDGTAWQVQAERAP